MNRIKATDRYILSTMPVFWAPMTSGHHSDGATFLSSDGRGYGCTVTGALWTPQGRQFDGIDDWITVPAKVTAGLSALTEWAWVKPTDASRNHHVISDYTADATTSAILIVEDVAASGTWRVGVGLKGATTAWNFASATTTTLAYGTWYLIGFSWDGTTRTFYVNGVADGTAAFSDTALLAAPTNNLALGRQYADATQRFQGTYGEAGISSLPKSAVWWANLYRATRWGYK